MTKRTIATVIITGLLSFTMCSCSELTQNQEEKEYPVATLTVTNKYTGSEFDLVTYYLVGIPSSDDTYFIEFELDNGYHHVYEITSNVLCQELFQKYDIGDTVQVTASSRSYDIYGNAYFLSSVGDNLSKYHEDFSFLVHNVNDYEWTYISEAEWQKLHNQ